MQSKMRCSHVHINGGITEGNASEQALHEPTAIRPTTVSRIVPAKSEPKILFQHQQKHISAIDDQSHANTYLSLSNARLSLQICHHRSERLCPCHGKMRVFAPCGLLDSSRVTQDHVRPVTRHPPHRSIDERRLLLELGICQL